MADQARRPVAPQPGSIIEPPAPRPAGLLPQDMLPDEATRDPAYREGAGSRYASGQPALAFKYGVVRNGQRIAPQQLAGRAPGLSAQTVEGLKAVEQFNRTREQAESADRRAEAESAAGAGGAAARIASPSGNADVAPSKMTAEELEKALSQLDDFDFNRLRESMMRDIINNEEQRKIIEERLIPLSLDDMIVNGHVTQVVPIIPGKFEPEFKSLEGDADLALKRLVTQEAQSIHINERYYLDKFGLMAIAAGLYAINRNPLPDYRDQEGNFSDDLFWMKFNRVMKLNINMLSSIGVNWFWFDVRVRKLFVAEKLGNG